MEEKENISSMLVAPRGFMEWMKQIPPPILKRTSVYQLDWFYKQIKQAEIQGIREGFKAANESRWEKVRQTGERYRFDLMRHPYPTVDDYLKSRGLL